MAKHRPEISNAVKKRLRTEAGHKCANPGCGNRRTHIHHIREWAVYQTHDEQHMIAVCPSCHDAIHHGAIPIDDAVLYQWKNISRSSGPIRSHIYVEPGAPAKLLLGTIAVTAPNRALVFQLSPFNRLKFSIIDIDILLIDLAVATLSGHEVLRVTDNYVRHDPRSDVEFLHVPGSISVSVPCTDEFIPDWAVRHMQIQEPMFGQKGRMTALAISVLKPGLARVEGVWALDDRAVVITRERLSFLRPDLQQPLSMIGDGEGSVLYYVSSGVIDIPLFGFGPASTLNVGHKG
ncbi:MAG: HNH endonuclease signature motif containing protein [Acidobacteriota bacterium]